MPDIETLSIQEVLSRRKECAVEYAGKQVTFSYSVTKLTSNFLTELTFLIHKGRRLAKVLSGQMHNLVNVDYDLTDEETRKQLDGIQAQIDAINHEIGELIAGVLTEWDLTTNGAPYDITAEHVDQLDGELTGAIIGALIKGGRPLGEASGQRSTNKPLPISRRKARRGT